MNPIDHIQILALAHGRTLKKGQSIRIRALRSEKAVLITGATGTIRYHAVGDKEIVSSKGATMRKVGNAIMLKIGGKTINYRTFCGHMQGSDRSRWQQMEPVCFLTYPSGRHVTANWMGDTLVCTCDRETNSTKKDASIDTLPLERPRMSRTRSKAYPSDADPNSTEPAKKRSGTGTVLMVLFTLYTGWHIWHSLFGR